MNCLICRQAETSDGFASLTLERGEMKFVMNKVPARVCPNCGESYVEAVVAQRLLFSAEQMAKTGELHNVQDYEQLSPR